MEPTYAVVAGGAGVLGAQLCARLLDEGAREVFCVDNLSQGKEARIAPLLGRPRFTFLKADICDVFLVPGKIERLYHLALPWEASVAGLRTRGEGTLRLLERAGRDRARVLIVPPVSASTAELSAGSPHSEALGLAFARERKEDVRVARLASLFGPGMGLDGGLVASLIETALKRRPIPIEGDGSDLYSLLYVPDAVEGLVQTMEREGLAGEVLFLGNGRRVCRRELARLVARACGTRVRIAFDALGAEPKGLATTTEEELTHQRLGWAPSASLEDALAATVEDLRPLVGPPEPRRRRRPVTPPAPTVATLFPGLR